MPLTEPSTKESDSRTLVISELSPSSSNEKDLETGQDVANALPSLAGAEPSTFLSGWKLASMITAVLLSLFPVTLDRTIIATAIPVITSDFQHLSEAPWLAVVYFLAMSGFVPMYGQLVKIFPTKWIFISVVGIFELGSVICGAAWNMNVMIWGRAVSGLGAAGIFVSCFVIITQVARLDQRPMIFGIIAAQLALGNICGPLLGGAITSHATWRWCFYINLPLGFTTVIWVLLFFKEAPQRKDSSEPSRLVRLLRIDWLGSVLFLAACACILIPLQWGGVERPWNDKVIIILFCVGGVTLGIFIGWQFFLGPQKAVLPLSMFGSRSSVGIVLGGFMFTLLQMVGLYYLPHFYQSARQKSAMSAGLEILPYMLAQVAGNGITSVFVTRSGKPWPWIFWSPFLAMVGFGLLFGELKTVTPGLTKLGVFQAIAGLGVGFGCQQSAVCIQAEFRKDPKLAPLATAILCSIQLFGGMIGVAIAGTIFTNKVRSGIALYAAGLDPQITTSVIESVAAVKMVPDVYMHGVLHAYSNALGYVFLFCVPVCAVGALSALLVKHYDLKN